MDHQISMIRDEGIKREAQARRSPIWITERPDRKLASQ